LKIENVGLRWKNIEYLHKNYQSKYIKPPSCFCFFSFVHLQICAFEKKNLGGKCPKKVALFLPPNKILIMSKILKPNKQQMKMPKKKLKKLK